MNKRALREAFVKHSGRYDLVGSKTVDGERMPDYDVDDGADYYVDAAVKLLSKEVLSTRNIRHFIKTATAAFPGACIENITHVDQVSVGGTPLGMALEADLMLSMSNETLTGTPTHWAECRDITFTSEEEEEEDPEIEWIDITTIEQLQLIGHSTEYPLSGNYRLMSNIDASVTKTWNDGHGFVPIGDRANPFTGLFIGRGHVVSNLFIETNPERRMAQGLFGWIVSGEVLDLKVTGSVLGGLYIGGICGVNDGNVERCAFSGDVIGYVASGVVGLNLRTVKDCYAVGTVTASDPENIGGCIGWNAGQVENLYAACVLVPRGGPMVGGCIGYTDPPTATSVNCFFDKDVAGTEQDLGTATPCTTGQMKQQITFTNWNFTDVWSIDVGVSYPILKFVDEQQEEESEEPETTTILIYPYPIIDTAMYISCWIYDPLVEDTDENWWSINYPEAIIDLAHAKLCTSQLDASKRTLESEVERIKIAVYKQDVRDEVRHLGSVIK